MAQDRRGNELREKDIQGADDQRRVLAGKKAEFDKLLKTGSIIIHTGTEAERIRNETDPKRILQSRFVKTRKGEDEIKCRWVIKGYLDPDIDILMRQSPTLSADGLAVAFQLIASFRWQAQIADVEGAFLQGEKLTRERGRIFASLPRDGAGDIPNDAVIELTKCVYGLMDAPLKWWRSIASTLTQLGMKQSELDSCVFLWFDNENQDRLGGILALHVDDMLVGGNKNFQEKVLSQLKIKYPFKHWVKMRVLSLGVR